MSKNKCNGYKEIGSICEQQRAGKIYDNENEISSKIFEMIENVYINNKKNRSYMTHYIQILLTDNTKKQVMTCKDFTSKTMK